jgi:Big-like domain-containing protein
VPGLSALGGGHPTDITALECPAAGRCVIGGWFVTPNNNLQPFVADSVNGTFGAAHLLITLDDSLHQFVAMVTAVTCSGVNYCAAAVTLPVFLPNGAGVTREGFLAAEVNGTWGAVQAVPGLPTSTNQLPFEFASISCWAPGDCMGGGYTTGINNNTRSFIVEESGGTWGQFANVPNLAPGNPLITGLDPNAASSLVSVKCSGNGDCAVAGEYGDIQGLQQAYTAERISGNWITQAVPGTLELDSGGQGAQVNDLACGALDDCAVAGQVTDSSGSLHSFVDGGTGGTWRNAQEIAGVANLPGDFTTSVACRGAGNCIAGGQYLDTAGHSNAFIANESSGSWGGAQQVAGNLNAGGGALVEDISCQGGDCALGGFYTDAAGHPQGFIVEESPQATTSLAVTPAAVTADNEQNVRVTATVTPFTGGTPTGTVTVLANGALGQSAVCTITLAGGTGTCPLPAGSLAAGAYSFTGNYSGDQFYSGSTFTSSGTALTVTPALSATTTTLGVQPATATFGSEQAVKLTVGVTAQAGGTPTGTVTITAGSATVGTITLANGTGTRALTASQLPPGSYQLVATYGGDQASKDSASAQQVLTVTAEPTSTALTLSSASVRVGHEQNERLTITVRPVVSGTPTGKVAVKAGTTTVCTITLASAKGSCTLTASQLAAGTYQLTASYPGATPYAASTSPAKTLTVTR